MGAMTWQQTRWRGQPGRLEVWYSTLTDPTTGTGFWLHTELVAPTSGAAFLHGWAAAFPVDGPPVQLFGTTVAADPSKQLQSVTLPGDDRFEVYAVSLG